MRIRLDTRKVYLAMAERGINGTDLAKEIGVSQQAMSNVLNGKRLGKAKILPGLCKALGFKPEEIVIFEEN